MKNSALPYGAQVELYVMVVDAGDVNAQAKAKANDTTTDTETSLP
jgi:hypothetical protein